MTRDTTVVARTVRSTPHRSATATWDLIVNLIAPQATSAARGELALVAGVACTCIADESLTDDPLVVYGAGPRVRVRALYGDDAIEGDAANESPLGFVPTDGDWRMSIPCLAEDFSWIERRLRAVSKRISARPVGEPVADARDEQGDDASAAESSSSAPVLGLDRDAFFRR